MAGFFCLGGFPPGEGRLKLSSIPRALGHSMKVNVMTSMVKPLRASAVRGQCAGRPFARAKFRNGAAACGGTTTCSFTGAGRSFMCSVHWLRARALFFRVPSG